MRRRAGETTCLGLDVHRTGAVGDHDGRVPAPVRDADMARIADQHGAARGVVADRHGTQFAVYDGAPCEVFGLSAGRKCGRSGPIGIGHLPAKRVGRSQRGEDAAEGHLFGIERVGESGARPSIRAASPVPCRCVGLRSCGP